MGECDRGAMNCAKSVVGVFVALLAILIAQVALTPKPDLLPDLNGRVALVTGASRGIGRGIAIGLGETGATVYITGRTMERGANNTGGPTEGTLKDTCLAVEQAGGKCVPVRCDSANDQELAAVFELIEKEAGKLDVLVNNAFSAVSWLPERMGQAFWEKGVGAWDQVNHVGLRSVSSNGSHSCLTMHRSTTMLRCTRHG